MSGIPDRALRRLREQLASEMRPPLPAVIAGRYEPVALLGRGGMGEVHRATDRLLGRDVAVKVLAATTDDAFTERLRLEARVLARLEHPGIVPVHDAGVLEDARAFYVMRLVEGARLDEFARTAGRGELLRTVLRVADAVAFAHGRGIIHRDLKPGNVMIGPFGEVLVLDWGVAKELGASERPMVVGTPGYMAPEQARGDAATDHRADIFALGVMLRELLAHPAQGPVPRPLASVIARATAAAPDARYGSVSELAEDVRRWLDGERVLAHRETVAERAWRFALRHQLAILLLLSYALLRTLALVWRGI